MRITDKYVFFWDGIYSNWYSVSFVYKGIRFSSSEQAMMYHKALTFNDVTRAYNILKTDNPRIQKELGRQILGYDDAIWSEKRFDIVTDICRKKFSQNPALKLELLSTGDKILVEASPYDTIWGIGMGENDIGVEDEKNWKGQNLLGKALVRVRNDF